MKRGRGGFTLLELLVALIVGGVALVGARAVYATLGDSADWIAEAAADADERANGERLLRTLVLEMEPTSRDQDAFEGDGDRASFSSWCRTSYGWKERCRVHIALSVAERGLAVQTLLLRTSVGDSLTLGTRRVGAQFAYLDDAAATGRWIARWMPSRSPPLAIGLLAPGDTLILRVGVRN